MEELIKQNPKPEPGKYYQIAVEILIYKEGSWLRGPHVNYNVDYDDLMQRLQDKNLIVHWWVEMKRDLRYGY